MKTLMTLSFVVASALAMPAHAAHPTIDQMHLAPFGGYQQSYSAGGTFMVMPTTAYYVLSDGTSWPSGAGSQRSYQATAPTVTVVDGLLHFRFEMPADGVLLDHTDFSFGDHSAQGVLGALTPLVIVAAPGSNSGELSGYTTVLSNDETWYGLPLFNYYSAAVGQHVWMQSTFTLGSATFTADLFDSGFDYNVTGVVDFTQLMPVPEPSSALLLACGLALVGVARSRRAPPQG